MFQLKFLGTISYLMLSCYSSSYAIGPEVFNWDYPILAKNEAASWPITGVYAFDLVFACV